MKTKEELNAIKEEVEAVRKKLAALTNDELEQVSGGGIIPGSGCPTIDPYPREDWEIWECSKCHAERETPAKDSAFYNKNNACECGGTYYRKGHRMR